ncbi:ribosome biogenesis factor YjgA [Chitinimonas sp.]|uniref:ribosome biogenesis factor YjgA n=1 Tax=Chitinimonas sp. TaxID=1934313 RepID=UPI0035B42D90
MSRHTPVNHDEFDQDDEIEIVSKSQMKREMNALQDLGVALIDLSRSHLKKLNLPDALFTAIIDAQKITANSAIKRQRQYIGRLMREVDPVPIQAYLDSLRGDNDKQTAWLHLIERTRDELLADDKAVARLIDEHAGIDIQSLRQMVRNARSERAANKPPKHFRALFQFLKTLYPEPQIVPQADADTEDEDEADD